MEPSWWTDLNALRRDLLGAARSRGLEQRTAPYGAGFHQDLLLWHPRTPPPSSGWPLLLLLHGGGYYTGSPADFASVAPWYARHGLFVAAVRYGLAPRHPFPRALHDVLHALAWLREQPVDFTRFGIQGFSAGGHLALLAALEAPHPPRAVAVGCAPTELVGHRIPGFPPGLPRTDRQRYSPALRDPPPGSAVLTVHGTDDDVVPYDHALALMRRWPGVKHHRLEGGDHALRHPPRTALKARDAMMAWLLEQLG